MSTLEDDWAALEVEMDELRKSQDRLDQELNRLKVKKIGISERVRRGETTGKLYRDYFLSWFNQYFEDYANVLRKIDSEISQNYGGLVMVVKKRNGYCRKRYHSRPLLNSLFPAPMMSYIEVYFQMGIINGEGLIIRPIILGEESPCAIPTGSYCEWNWKRKELSIISGNIGSNHAHEFFIDLNRPLDSASSSHVPKIPDHHLEIVVGSKAVLEWFSLRGAEYLDQYSSAHQLLIQSIKGSSDAEGSSELISAMNQTSHSPAE